MVKPFEPSETEIKLVASPAILGQLRAHPALAGDDRTASLVTTYFDTSSGRLRRGGASLRMREGPEGREQTLKLASTLGPSASRREWTIAAKGDSPEPDDFPEAARAALLDLLEGAPLEPLATTRIERTSRRLHQGTSVIELAFDVGAIEAGERKADVCELELELVEGRFSDLAEVALQLPLGPDLRWSLRSKAEQCHALALGLQPVAARARPVKLDPRMAVTDGFKAIAWNCLDQLLNNYLLVLASGDAESLHQCRVAIRRLRAAFSLFGDVAEDAAAPILRAELKAVAKGLGPARDLEVLLVQIASAAQGEPHRLEELVTHLAAKRDAAVAAGQELLASVSFQRLLFELARWIEDGAWLAQRAERHGDRPLVPFASQVLSRRRRKLRIEGSLAKLPPLTRHHLRIEAKKLRYATEFFASLYRGKAIAREREDFGKALEKLQDSLGQLNDLRVAAADLPAMFQDLEPIAGARLAAQLGGLLEEPLKSRHALLGEAQRSLAKVADARAWWKAD